MPDEGQDKGGYINYEIYGRKPWLPQRKERSSQNEKIGVKSTGADKQN
jgi:hypothetical protein